RGGAPLSKWRDLAPGRRSLAGALRPDVPGAGGPARPLHRSVPELRDQLQPRPGPRAAVHREARRHLGPAGGALAGIREADLLAAVAFGVALGVRAPTTPRSSSPTRPRSWRR